MKIGVRGHDYGRHGVAEYARLLHDEGYDTVQLAVPKAITGINGFDDITPSLLEEIREEFTKQKVEIGVFSCYVDLSNPDDEVRARAVDTFCKSLGYAKAAGAKMVGTETSYEKLGRTEKSRRFPFMMDSIKRIAEEAERVGEEIGLEPVVFYPLEDMETAAEVLEEIGSGKLRIIFDPANLLQRPEEVRQEAYWKRCLALGGDRIAALHVKDFTVDEKGERKACALGDGVMELAPLWEWVKGREDVAVIRDELDLAFARRDIEYLQRIKNLG
ncbi:MAG: sugar phosphate isomerase/epimerase [Clostridium sp.]|nr:sugar phosphate isomerase/epimerase [Clostridium sp.]